MALNLRVEYCPALTEVKNAYDIGHGVAIFRFHELRINVRTSVKQLFIEHAAVLAGIERNIERSGLNEILEEMAAIAQLGTQSVGAVGQFRNAVKAVYLHEMHRYAETGRCRAPASRTEQDSALAAKNGV